MRVTRVRATGLLGLSTSNTSQSPIQKSNCRYFGSEQAADFAESAEAIDGAITPIAAAKTMLAEEIPVVDHLVVALMEFLAMMKQFHIVRSGTACVSRKFQVRKRPALTTSIDSIKLKC